MRKLTLTLKAKSPKHEDLLINTVAGFIQAKWPGLEDDFAVDHENFEGDLEVKVHDRPKPAKRKPAAAKASKPRKELPLDRLMMAE